MKNAEKKYLRAKAHGLKPVIIIGAKGLTESVQAEIARALLDHELIKIRISHKDRDLRKSISEAIVAEQAATLIQTIGHIITIYKPAPN